LRKTGLSLLLIWLAILTQACVSEMKPYLKVDPDIPARIASQQKLLDRESKGGALPPERTREIQKKLDLVKARHSRLEAEGKLDDAEVRKLTRMLDETGNMLLKTGAPKTAAPPQPVKGKKGKNVE